MSVCRIFPLSFSLAFLVAAPSHAVDYQQGYLVDKVLLPTTASQSASYAIDIDGDGFVENVFGQLLAALTSQGLNLTGTTDAAVANGSIVHLLSLHSADPLFQSDPAAQADWYVGLPALSPPLFDGTDNLAHDGSIAPGIFLAALSNGSFASPSPATMTSPVSLTIELSSGPGKIKMPVQRARLSFSLDGGGHMQGQLNGAILNNDFVVLIPLWLSGMCNAYIQSDPTSDNANTCKSAFDDGCSGNAGSAGDGMIEVCEVAENPAIGTLTAPDIQIPNASSGYDLANSLGLRFTAIASPDRVFADGFDP